LARFIFALIDQKCEIERRFTGDTDDFQSEILHTTFMKSQIALIGIGIAIAGAVAYAELKPASAPAPLTTISTPEPTASTVATPTAKSVPDKATTPEKSATPVKTKPQKIKATPNIPSPTVSKPTISGGGGDDDDDYEGNERDHDDDDDD
jgi:hypothetical protein